MESGKTLFFVEKRDDEIDFHGAERSQSAPNPGLNRVFSRPPTLCHNDLR
jgi:hypothetical protein